MRRIILILMIILVLLAAAIWHLQGMEGLAADNTSAKARGPVALVHTAPIREGVLTEKIAAYGKVIPAPGALQTVSVPFESQVVRIMVNNGQKVGKGNDLLEIKPSPDTYLKLQQARQTYKLSQQSLRFVERRFELKLATNDQVLRARQALAQARLRLESMKKRGIGPPRLIRADVGGLIRKVYVQEGAIVPPGHPLMEVVTQNRLEVRLGLEPDNINRIKINQPVLISRVNVPALGEVTGHIRKVSYGVNPNTRLVDVFVSLPSNADFLLGESVVGHITVARARGLLVPRAAVLPAGRAYTLFTIQKGRGVRHLVQVGLKNAKEVEVKGRGLRAGETVVVLGNYELKDGMAVRVEKAP
ncbi:MAG TPA: efflux RND transporter periplasmic adaptor subunit [Desulfobaccales bacterium]|nr:efflux RND transporter periplasmic adaptor subunit [Desulfobaccales bacterium]